jgi:hypothetical protein
MGRNWVTTREWLKAYLAAERKVGRPARLNSRPAGPAKKSDFPGSSLAEPVPVRVAEAVAVRSSFNFIPRPNVSVRYGQTQLISYPAVSARLNSRTGGPAAKAPALYLAYSITGLLLISFAVFAVVSPAIQGALGSILEDASARRGGAEEGGTTDDAFSLQALVDTLKQTGGFVERGLAQAAEFVSEKMTAEMVITN